LQCACDLGYYPWRGESNRGRVVPLHESGEERARNSRGGRFLAEPFSAFSEWRVIRTELAEQSPEGTDGASW
jgi:hypothetical protein